MIIKNGMSGAAARTEYQKEKEKKDLQEKEGKQFT